ncbi:MAG: N-acetylmuramoyl-L-alanine amidase, partial [Clostridium sp.]|uniref:N-acetylmuramoyl-L-alanine amidase family protein n=1 Tax=Clostridium sp. TaxID=1506 RepID=UPI0025B8D813
SNDSLKERIKFSEVLKADLFVSIHCNSDYNNQDSKGVETWYKLKDENSKNLALTIQNELINANYTEDRKVKTYSNKEDALAVLELNSSIPVLLELGFLSNQSDERYLKSDKGKDAIITAIKNALLDYIEENKASILKDR